MKKKITSHNIKVQKTEEDQQMDPGCNCTGAMGPCPLDGKCLVNSEVKDSNNYKQTYTGLTAGTFKKDIILTETASWTETQNILQLCRPTSGASKTSKKILKSIGE